LIKCVEELCEINKAQGGKSALNSRNQHFIVEVIRNIAEYAVYSERFGQTFLETMIEQNCFNHFAEVLCMNNRAVNLQLIQTTSILLANIKTPQKQCKSTKPDLLRLHPQPSIFEPPYLVQIQFLRRRTSRHLRLILESNRFINRRDYNQVLHQLSQQQLPSPRDHF
jgi:hypothetical protein